MSSAPFSRDSADSVLLTKRLENEIGHGTLCLPGGKIEPGETPEEAIARELEEELGISAQHLILYDSKSDSNYICHYFLGRLIQAPTPNLTQIGGILYLILDEIEDWEFSFEHDVILRNFFSRDV